jgi:CO dehydrogenase/acetyl-CoA synthase delta subunit
MTARHRVAAPHRARVRADPSGGRPLVVEGRTVEAVRESWLVEDRWWNGAPVRRRYWEVVTTCGRDLVVFHDLRGGEWFVQR